MLDYARACRVESVESVALLVHSVIAIMWKTEQLNDSLPTLDLGLEFGYGFSDSIADAEVENAFIKTLVSEQMIQEENEKLSSLASDFTTKIEGAMEKKKGCKARPVERKSDRNGDLSNSSEGKIPRPPNSFMLFAKEYRRIIANANPGRANKEISILLGEAWKGLDEKEKEKYIQEAELQRRKHRSMYPNYIYSPIEARARKAGKMATKSDEKKEVDSTEERKLVASSSHQLTCPVVQEFELHNHSQLSHTCSPLPVGAGLVESEIYNNHDSTTSSLDGKDNMDKNKIMTEVYIAPPGYEDVEIMGMEKFVAYQNKLIPYSEWCKVSGDVHKLALDAYSDVPAAVAKQIIEPVDSSLDTTVDTATAAAAAMTTITNTSTTNCPTILPVGSGTLSDRVTGAGTVVQLENMYSMLMDNEQQMNQDFTFSESATNELYPSTFNENEIDPSLMRTVEEWFSSAQY